MNQNENAKVPYSAKAVANELLEIARKYGQTLTPMKLQKLLYFTNAWYLALKEEPLIDELVEAWQWGPVVPSIYHALKNFGPNFIEGLCKDEDGNIPRIPQTDTYTHSLLNEVWRVYGHLTAIQLSNLSHVKDGPWDTANAENTMQLKNWPIRNEVIKTHFQRLRHNG